MAGIYVAISAQANRTPLSDASELQTQVDRALAEGVPPPLIDRALRTRGRQERFEQAVNESTLARLRTTGFVGLGGLALLSLGIGYVVAGRVLAPVTEITRRAREMGTRTPDLSGRIALRGPHDELRELADTLDDFLARTEAAVTSQRRFLADAAHELRTPLTAAKTTLDVALEEPGADERELRRAATVAQRQLTRMGRLIGDLLALERAKGTRPRVVDLREVAAAAAADLEIRASGHGVSLSVESGAALHARVDADDLRRALLNLIENAIVHNRPGGHAEVRFERVADRVRVVVSDDGPGIAPQEQARVFERFHRDGGEGGTGLGLAIVRELARAAGGDVCLESAPGAGATFTLELPAADASPA